MARYLTVAYTINKLDIMILKTVVEHDKSGLEMVLDAMNELLEEKFVEGIKNKHRTLYEIKQMTELLGIYQHRINIKSNAVSKFAETFIRSFATPNNRCFNTTEELFTKIKSTIASLKDVFYKTSATDRTQLPEGVEVPTVFERSPLGHGNYTADVFGLSSYPKEVQDLYNALETMFSSATSTLALCHMMIEQEDTTRNDIVQLRQIYKESCNKMLEAVNAATAFITSSQELPENEMEKLREKAGSEDNEKFLKSGYHNYDKKIMTQYLIIKTVKQARNEGLTEQEAFFWRKNHKKALLVRKVIDNFDKIKDVEGQKGSLSSRVLVEFLKWCGVNESIETQLYKYYFQPKYSTKGKFKPIGWNTISGRRKELIDLGATGESLAKDFEKRLENVLTLQELAA